MRLIPSDCFLTRSDIPIFPREARRQAAPSKDRNSIFAPPLPDGRLGQGLPAIDEVSSDERICAGSPEISDHSPGAH